MYELGPATGGRSRVGKFVGIYFRFASVEVHLVTVQEPPFTNASGDRIGLVTDEEDDEDRQSNVPEKEASDGEIAGGEDGEGVGLRSARVLTTYDKDQLLLTRKIMP